MFKSKTRLTHIALALTFGATTLLATSHYATPAFADGCVLDPQSSALQPGWGATCPGTTTSGSGTSGTGSTGGAGSVGGGGNSGGSSGPQSPPTGKMWIRQDNPSFGPCGANNAGTLYMFYSKWANDPTGPIVDSASPATIQCVMPDQQTTGQGTSAPAAPVLPPIAQLQQQVKLLVVPGTPATDFQSFLTGAQIGFTGTAPADLRKDLNVPGFHVWFDAQPTFQWNFGDSDPGDKSTNTASGQSVSHQYNELPGDGSNITVTLTTVWNGVLNIDATGTSGSQQIPLDPISLDTSLVRPIVQVKSVQTEPSDV